MTTIPVQEESDLTIFSENNLFGESDNINTNQRTSGRNNDRRILSSITRTNCDPSGKPSPTPPIEEQLIRNRGRRQWIKQEMKTPPRRKRSASSMMTPESKKARPNESPFTKSLRGLMSPINTSISGSSSANSQSTTPPNSSKSASSSFSRLTSTNVDAVKKYYYSPNPPYQLRSMDVIKKSNDSSNSMNDSGIGLSPDLSTQSIGSIEKLNEQEASTSSTENVATDSVHKNRRINRVRRRFRF